jgi:hypothetical protein
LGDVGGLQSTVWVIGYYLTWFVSSNSLAYHLMRGVYKTAFKFKLRDASSCKKTKRKLAMDRGQQRIDYELDVVNFIRFQLQTRSLMKQLFTTERRKAAK